MSFKLSISYFQAANFEAMMTVNVTLLLVLTTLFIGTSNSLPRTSYVKYIDIWLIVNLLILFVDIILQTVINDISEDMDKPDPKFMRFVRPSQGQPLDNVEKKFILTDKEKLAFLNIFSKFLLPSFYLVFCIIYFIIGLVVRWDSGQQT